MFLRTSAGGLQVDQFNGSGALTGSQAFTFQGAPVLVDTATSVVGAGEDFFGLGGHTAFVRGEGGGLSAWEFDNSGAFIRQGFFSSQGSAVTIDTGTTVVGGGTDLFGDGGHDVFLRGIGGALSVLNTDSNGLLDIRQAFTVGGAALTLDSGSRITGSAGDYFGTGGHGVYVLDAGGTQHVWEFNGAGVRTGAT